MSSLGRLVFVLRPINKFVVNAIINRPLRSPGALPGRDLVESRSLLTAATLFGDPRRAATAPAGISSLAGNGHRHANLG
jgi:hypothetical protein